MTTPFHDSEWQRLALAYHLSVVACIEHEIEQAEADVRYARYAFRMEAARRQLEVARIEDLTRHSAEAGRELARAERAYRAFLDGQAPTRPAYLGVALLRTKQNARAAMDARWNEVSATLSSRGGR